MITKFMKVWHLNDVCVDASRLEGTASIMVQIQNRRAWTESDAVPRSFFRRACKREGISSAFMLRYLKEAGWISEGYDVFPLTLLVPPFTFLSYEEWQSAGSRVVRGSTSFARRGENNQALFSNFQVTRITK